MKSFKKIIFAFMALMFAVTVHAANTDQLKEYGAADVTTGDDGVITVKLKAQKDGNVKQDIIINNNQTVVLDLNGQTLENFCDACSAIDVQEGAKLTIVDNAGNGKIVPKSGTNEKVPLISNKGTLIIEKGTIEAGTKTAAGIYNAANLTISGGTIKTTIDAAWGVTNDKNGTALISGGTFIQGKNYSVILNSGKMDITSGTFKTEGDTTHNSLITNKKAEDGNNATLNVKGGDFTASILFYNEGEDKLTITGGKFSKDSNINNYLKDTNYEVDAEGNVVLKAADYTELNSQIAEAKKIDKTKYTEETVKAFEEALKKAEEIDKNLTIDKQSQIDKVLTELKTAIKNLKEISTPTEKEDDNKENTEKEIVKDVMYTDNGEGIEIEGSIVTETTEATNETYSKMVDLLKEKGYTEVFNMYEFHITNNKSLTKLLTITFDLGEKNNGRVAYILHQKHDGSYEAFENTVENGKVSITVSELSPFVVALKDKEEETVEESTGNNAQTASSDILKYGILSVGTLVSFVALVVKMKKEQI